MKMLIKNGHVVNADSEMVCDILVEDGIVKKMGADLYDESSSDLYDEIIDATGKYVMPGFIDLHVHFREPGLTHKETVKTGSLAAARGGYTSVFCMPNTKPVIDSAREYKNLIDIIER